MANTLSKTGITNGNTILPGHVTQSIDALTGTQAYDITISGSLTLTGSVSSQNGFIGDLVGTASLASVAVNADNATTSSYALTATSSSYASSGSYSATAVSASYAATASSADTLIVRTSLTASGLNYPTTDGTNKEVLKTNGSGLLEFGHVDTIYETIQAGESLVKTDPVYLSGSQGAVPIAYKADPSDPTKSPAVYICNETLSTGQRGDAIALGLIEGIDLTGLEAGTPVYLGVGGGWTPIRPTGSVSIQTLGIVTKGGNGGKGFVFNAGEATLPNIPEGYTWIGDSDHYPQAVTTASILGAGSYGGVYQSGSGTGISGPLKFIAGASETDGSGAATVTVNELTAGGVRVLNQTFFVTLGVEDVDPTKTVSIRPGSFAPTLQFTSSVANTRFHFQIMYI